MTNKIYVANYGSNTVSVVDGATNGVTSVGVGCDPYAVAVNTVTNKIYVANTWGNTVSVIDGATNGVVSVSVGSFPVAVAVNPVTNKIYVANYGSNTVSVIYGATSGVTNLNVGTNPGAVAVNPVTNCIYAVNVASHTVSVIDGATNGVTLVSVGYGPQAVAVNPVTNRAAGADRRSRELLDQEVHRVGRKLSFGGDDVLGGVAIDEDEGHHAAHRTAARVVQVELEVEVDEGLPATLVDRDAVSQAVLNLLDNAVKYSRDVKQIPVRVARGERAASARMGVPRGSSANGNGAGTILVEVSDRGIGIPPAELDRIFEAFYRVEKGLEHDVKGSGLGLADRRPQVHPRAAGRGPCREGEVLGPRQPENAHRNDPLLQPPPPRNAPSRARGGA